MQRFQELIRGVAGRFLVAAFAVMLGIQGFTAAAANAAEQYLTPDGNDITALVDCLPEQLSEGDLQRAIAEAGNDYLERVFQTKENYDDYKISEAEKEFQACLKRQGIVPAAKANMLER